MDSEENSEEIGELLNSIAANPIDDENDDNYVEAEEFEEMDNNEEDNATDVETEGEELPKVKRGRKKKKAKKKVTKKRRKREADSDTGEEVQTKKRKKGKAPPKVKKKKRVQREKPDEKARRKDEEIEKISQIEYEQRNFKVQTATNAGMGKGLFTKNK